MEAEKAGMRRSAGRECVRWESKKRERLETRFGFKRPAVREAQANTPERGEGMRKVGIERRRRGLETRFGFKRPAIREAQTYAPEGGERGA